jgi:hypothetical protein
MSKQTNFSQLLSMLNLQECRTIANGNCYFNALLQAFKVYSDRPNNHYENGLISACIYHYSQLSIFLSENPGMDDRYNKAAENVKKFKRAVMKHVQRMYQLGTLDRDIIATLFADTSSGTDTPGTIANFETKLIKHFNSTDFGDYNPDSLTSLLATQTFVPIVIVCVRSDELVSVNLYHPIPARSLNWTTPSTQIREITQTLSHLNCIYLLNYRDSHYISLLPKSFELDLALIIQEMSVAELSKVETRPATPPRPKTPVSLEREWADGIVEFIRAQYEKIESDFHNPKIRQQQLETFKNRLRRNGIPIDISNIRSFEQLYPKREEFNYKIQSIIL